MLFATLVETSRRVAATSKRLEKSSSPPSSPAAPAKAKSASAIPP
jgi:hypothetical protein